MQDRRTKEFHDFFTPESETEATTKAVLKLLKKKKVNKILDPAVGAGSLIWPILASKYKVEFTVMDIQQDYLDFTLKKAKKLGYEVKGNRIRNFKNGKKTKKDK